MEINRDVLYISYVRFPSEKAHSLYIAKVCESFFNVGLLCKVIVPKRFFVSYKKPKIFYNLKHNFDVVYLGSIDLFPFIPFKKIAHRAGLFSFTFSVLFYVLKNVSKNTILITNDTFVALLLTFFRKKVVLEIHDYPKKKNFFYSITIFRVWKIITNNFQKKNKIINEYNVSEKKILAKHNGISINQFNIEISKKEARKILSISNKIKVVVYTGSFQKWKGVDTLIGVAKKNKDIHFYFVGDLKFGNDIDVEKCKKFSNIHFVGLKPHGEIPLWQKVADILVLPNTAKSQVSKYFTSPMKLFEYMASRRPVVASNLPSITEILNENNAVLVEPDNVKSMTNAIKKLFEDKSFSNKIADKAFKDVKKYTWHKRAQDIVNFLSA